jgi:hypothetical protein
MYMAGECSAHYVLIDYRMETVNSSCAVVCAAVHLTNDNPALAAAERRCEPGFYCVGGIKALCARGRWGGSYGLVSGDDENSVPLLLICACCT